MSDDGAIARDAVEFAKANKKAIARELTDPARFPPDEFPVSAFMAGSPGAGKTELSRRFVGILEKNKGHEVIRIDGDDLRSRLPGYTGTNSSLFQGAVSILVEKIHDVALERGQSFLLDGTLANYEKAAQNIERSLSRKRPVFIFYVYQHPEVAWRFTQAREAAEGRNIPKSAFIDQFIGARESVGRIRREFDDQQVAVFLVKKDFETHAVQDIVEIERGGDQIDRYLGERYDRDYLEKLL